MSAGSVIDTGVWKAIEFKEPVDCAQSEVSDFFSCKSMQKIFNVERMDIKKKT